MKLFKRQHYRRLWHHRYAFMSHPRCVDTVLWRRAGEDVNV